jgi:methyltransferase (TIGR00027 family)
MENTRANTTAEGAAAMRALHQRLPPSQRIFDDPLAELLVDLNGNAGRAVEKMFNGVPPSVRSRLTSFVLRSRYSEDCLHEAVLRGVQQYVLLGAGLDTFAYRQPSWARELTIFEFDFPATQTWKLERLAAAGISIPANVRYIPGDLTHAKTLFLLQDRGVDLRRAVFFAMLGVSQYLPEEAFRTMLQVFAHLPRGSEIVFNVVVTDDLMPMDEAKMTADFAARAASFHEPWHTRVRPSDLSADLLSYGFSKIEHLSPEKANAQYFKYRHDDLQAPYQTQMMRALV